MKLILFLLIWLLTNLIIIFMCTGLTIISGGILGLPTLWLFSAINLLMGIYFVYLLITSTSFAYYPTIQDSFENIGRKIKTNINYYL